METLRQVADEIEEVTIDAEGDFYGSKLKRRMSNLAEMPPKTRAFIEELNSASFVSTLEDLTGIRDLIPDPYLEGGGIHQIGAGGFLKVHTDFNWHRKLQLHRRVNLLIYLNEEWESEWKGNLELWDEEMRQCHVSVPPLFNHIVIFTTTDRSYHGHPDPLECPPGIMRKSIAMYYYSKERPTDEIKFGRSELTNYRARPTERFSKKYRLHQMLIRHPLIRKIIKRVTGN